MPSISIENGKRIEELLEISRVSSDAFFLVSDNALTRKITLKNLRNMFSGDTATSDLNNLYYTVEKVNELLGHIYDDISKINTKLDNFEDRIDNIYNDLGAELSEFKKYVEQIYAELKLADQTLQNNINKVKNDLTELIESNYDELEALINQTKSDLTTLINNTKTELNNKIDTVNSELTSKINKVNTDLTNKINQVNSDLSSKISSLTTRVTTAENNITSMKSDISDLKSRMTVVENKLSGITSIRYGSSVPSSLSTGAIYLQYF